MIRMFPRRRNQISLGVGGDSVLFGISLPSDCRLNGLWAQVHVLSDAVIPITEARMYAIEGYVLPVLDPDSGASFDTIWDTLVPKDNDTDTIDLDTGASDSQSFFEPGEMALEEVMDVGLQPQRIFGKSFFKTYANGAMRQEDASINEWVLADRVSIRIRKRYRVSQPSVVLFALGNPAMDDTTSPGGSALAENEWPRVKYMESTLEMALMQHFGLLDVGAESPFEDAAILLRKYIEPDVGENNAGAWGAGTLKAFVNATLDVSAPGTMGKIQVGTGG